MLASPLPNLMSEIEIKSHHKGNIVNKLGDIGHDALEDILHIGLNRLGGLARWVSSGTLLSLHRDARFKPEDNDIDVGVLNVDIDRENIISRMFPWAPYREVTYEGKLQQFAFVADHNILFDICFYSPMTDGQGDHLVQFTRTTRITKPAELFNPVKMWDSPAGMIPAPNDLDGYCEMRYGKKWMIPSKGKGIYDGRF